MHRGGIRGVRFNFVKHLGGRPDMAFFDRTVARLKDMGWHLILHLDSADLVEFRKKFEAIPVPMVIDHMGRVKAADGLEQEPFKVLLNFMKLENFLGEGLRCRAGVVERAAVRRRGALRASADRGRARADPLGYRLAASQRGQAHAERRRPRRSFRRMAPEPELQRKILVENPARLYGFAETSHDASSARIHRLRRGGPGARRGVPRRRRRRHRRLGQSFPRRVGWREPAGRG
jgi:hypothetical protein